MTKSFTALSSCICILLLSFATASFADWNDGKMPHKADPKVSPKAIAFPLESVRLLDGPFKDAQDKDAEYLLSVEPDKLLAKFRKNAGLKEKAEHYQGWEGQGIAGHSLGHYLSAVAMMYASTGDERFKKNADYILAELDECQKAGKDGLLAAFPDARKSFAEISSGDIRSQGFDLNGHWVPWYTFHKEFAGLIDAFRYAKNEKALEIACKFADWADDATKNLDENQFQKMLDCEHGGMNEVLYELYSITGNEKYLKLADRFYHKKILDPFAEGKDILPGKHGNTQFPKVIGVARAYEIGGDEKYRKLVEFFWDRVVNHHTYVTGGNTLGEHFGEPDKLNDRLGALTTETCNTHNMLRMTRHLYAWTADPKYFDFYERAIFNHILASIGPKEDKEKLFAYFVPLNSGAFRTYSDPINNWTCCHGTGMENHAKYGDSIYFHGPNDDSLYVNLLIPSTLDWAEKGIKATLTQDTGHRGKFVLKFKTSGPASSGVTLMFRVPKWGTGDFKLSLNGKNVDDRTIGKSGYLECGKIGNGDVYEFVFSLQIRTETMPDNPDRLAFLCGPLVLAGDLGSIDKPIAEPHEPVSEKSSHVPVLVSDTRDAEKFVDFADFMLRKESAKPREVHLVPFFAAQERYVVYFDRFTPESWKEKELEYKKELQRQADLEKRTIDKFQPGEMQPERDHNLKGEKTSSGDAFGHKWRHAFDGGYFEFDMKVDPEKQNLLLCTYWGGDSGNREFDIMIDGGKIATQKLDNNAPERFFDAEYALPLEVTKGKSKVAVRLQCSKGKTAGGLFGAKTMLK